MAEVATRPCAVYSLYDATGALLYVGLTVNLKSRLQAHKWEKWWFGEVARIEEEECPDQRTAEARELVLIEQGRPRHNQRTWRQGIRGQGVTKPKMKTNFTVPEAAAFLNVSTRKVWSAIRRGELIATTRGDWTTITRRALVTYAAIFLPPTP